MKTLFEYLYYRLYSWNLRTWGESDMPQFNALIGVSFMMFMNLLAVWGLIEAIGLLNLDRSSVKWCGGVVLVLVWIGNFSWLVRGRRYLKLHDKYEGESPSRKRRNMMLLWVYVLVSFGVVIGVAELALRFHQV